MSDTIRVSDARAKHLAEILRTGDLAAALQELIEARAEIERLTLERDGAIAARDHANRLYQELSEDRSSMAEERDKLERELAEAREFNRRFSGAVYAAAGTVYPEEYHRVRNDYLASQASQPEQPQPEPVDWVPWDQHTFPIDCEWLRDTSHHRYRIATVISAGVIICFRDHNQLLTWEKLPREFREWSRDGKTWQKCGVPHG